MGRMNAEVDPRAEQEKYNADVDSRRERNVGSQGKVYGHKYERTCRADSSRSDFAGYGYPVTGKIVRQLIVDYTDQVAKKREQKKQVEDEILQLDCKIEEFTLLLEQIETNKKT